MWSYKGETGPENWHLLNKNFCACNGKMQSPIDICDAIHIPDLEEIPMYYEASDFSHKTILHGYYIYPKGHSYLYLNNTRFNLMECHFHARSEHAIDGVFFPLELHLVHRTVHREFAVIGVMIDEGPANNELEKIIKSISNQQLSLNPKKLLPAKKDYYQYKGSLTTPPCAESVQWYIMRDYLYASKEQIATIASMLDNNFRPLQAKNGREIQLYCKSKGDNI